MASLELSADTSAASKPKLAVATQRPRTIQHENSLGPVGHNRRASQEGVSTPTIDSAVSPSTVLPNGLEIPMTKKPDNESIGIKHHNSPEFASKLGVMQEPEDALDRHKVTLIAVDELELPHANGKLPFHHGRRQAHLGARPAKTIYAGPAGNQKRLDIPTDLLEAKSKYFQRLLEYDPELDHMVFDDTDPFAMCMLMRWLVVGTLEEPDSFHSLTHWFALYTIGTRFEMEELRNHVMDTIRHYYRHQIQTASPFRLEYIFKFTSEHDQMRMFVVATAASRALITGTISESMRSLLAKGGDLPTHFAQALIDYSRNPLSDVRGSPDCQWHIHNHTPPCSEESEEVQIDGV